MAVWNGSDGCRKVTTKSIFTTDLGTIPHAYDTIAAGRIETLLTGAASIVIL